MEKNISEIEKEAIERLDNTAEIEAIKELSLHYLGRKGVLTKFLRNVSTLPEEERPIAGKNANILKGKLDALFNKALKELESKQDSNISGIDITLPGRSYNRGSLHPITQISNEISDIFLRLGFDIAESPEVETDYYNFEALNIPKYHPARAMQDTFYISENIVLRTHTSPSQPRTMEKKEPPVRIISPGKVFRCDSDLTHTPMFHQVEGLMVDKDVSFGDLKGILTTFIHQMFDKKT
ncbi:MAG: phenylalanine--tRNA ligase subunit alpha, partial [Desulfobacteraceae bacterium]|nr:phenylalanine--tRNA ligase subunit alpha [Desulfobacteraceae bacterium]